MTSPIETNNVVERLRESAKAYRGMLHESHANDCIDAADLIQSLSDHIDVLEGDKRAIVEWLRYRITDEAAEYKTVFAARLASAIEAGDYRLASLTQGGKNVAE